MNRNPMVTPQEQALAHDRIRELREKLAAEKERQQQRLHPGQQQQQKTVIMPSLPPRINTPPQTPLPNYSPPSSPGMSTMSSGTKMQGLLEKIADLEARLSVANRVADFLKTDAQAQQERNRVLGNLLQ